MGGKRICIDQREPGYFRIDNELILVYMKEKKINTYDLAVYSIIVMRAGKKDNSFPSIRGMSRDLGISAARVQKSIKNLERQNLLEIKRSKSETNRNEHNTYYILQVEKSARKKQKSTVLQHDTPKYDGVPSDSTPCTAPQHSVYRETGRNNTHLSNTHLSNILQNTFLKIENAKKEQKDPGDCITEQEYRFYIMSLFFKMQPILKERFENNDKYILKLDKQLEEDIMPKLKESNIYGGLIRKAVHYIQDNVSDNPKLLDHSTIEGFFNLQYKGWGIEIMINKYAGCFDNLYMFYYRKIKNNDGTVTEVQRIKRKGEKIYSTVN